MSLYGALFGGVSGLAAQGAKIGIVSDNIANVNTVGYKETEAVFQTLVVNSASAGLYQTGGVLNSNRIGIDQQGLILPTNIATDIAISGQGLFVVSADANSTTSQPLYTRAGSFRQDNEGNFINAAGFYLRAWPLDRDGRLPGELGNTNTTSFASLQSLQTVNVEASSGVALGTETIEISANLKASEKVYPGKAGIVDMDENDVLNFENTSDKIIVPAEYGLATANHLTRGDSMLVSTGKGLNYTYEYGGFTIGRDITTTGYSNNYGDGLNPLIKSLPGSSVTYVGDGASGITIDFGMNHGLITGDEITIAGDTTGFGAVNPLDGTYTVTWISATQVFISTTTAHGVAAGPAAAGDPLSTVTFSPFLNTGNVFDARSTTDAFFGTTGTSRFTRDSLSFTISTSTDTHTFTYSASSPNVYAGQFNSLTTLAQAITNVSDLVARVAGGRLVIGGRDADESITFANGDATTSTATAVGIDWISALDLKDVAAGSNRFNSMDSLAAQVNSDDGISAVVKDPLSTATLEINVDDPLDTIQFHDLALSTQIRADGTATYTYTSAAAAANTAVSVTVDIAVDPATLGFNVGDYIVIQNDTTAGLGLPNTWPNTPGNVQAQIVSVTATSFTYAIPASYNTAGTAGFGATNVSAGTTFSVLSEGNQGSVVSELGLTASLAGANYTPQDTGSLGPEYDSSGTVGKNMASGEIIAQFSRSVRIFDKQGTGHDLTIAYIKTDANTWAVEAYLAEKSEVTTALADGQVAVGTITFNGDGSLRSVSPSLSNAFTIDWTNGAGQSEITIDWGTAGQPFGTPGATIIGDTDGLSQFDGDYTVNAIRQDGAAVGQLISVAIDQDGFVNATYSNGETRSLYKIPIADFANINGLKAVTGNVYEETRESGEVTLRNAGNDGMGKVVGAALEQSNVELSEQLTDMIVAQRAYQANTRVISTSDQLLEELTQL